VDATADALTATGKAHRMRGHAKEGTLTSNANASAGAEPLPPLQLTSGRGNNVQGAMATPRALLKRTSATAMGQRLGRGGQTLRASTCTQAQKGPTDTSARTGCTCPDRSGTALITRGRVGAQTGARETGQGSGRCPACGFWLHRRRRARTAWRRPPVPRSALRRARLASAGTR